MNEWWQEWTCNKNIIFIDKIDLHDEKMGLYGNEIKSNIDNLLDVKYSIEEIKPENISENEFNELLEIANNWFWIKMSLDDVKNHLLKSDLLYLMKINNNIVGFSAIVFIKNLIYRYWTVIKKEFQNHGLYKILNDNIKINNQTYFVRTQNKNVIKSLEKSYNNILYWKDAYDYLLNNLSENELKDFFIKLWDEKNFLTENGLFEWVYWWYMWDKDNVNYIDEKFCTWFDASNWDSLLIVYFNKK